MLTRTFARLSAAFALTLAAAAAAAPASAATTVQKSSFGKLSDGREIDAYTLSDADGNSVTVITYGAILARVRTPDRDGHVGDVLLGYDNAETYETANGPHFGGLIGRVANRIAGGTFKVGDQTYHVPINNGPNALHGGTVGYDKRVWSAEVVQQDPTGPAVKMSLVDPAGTMGFPGTVHADVTYSLVGRGTFRIQYHATTDATTPINLTSHGYWNLTDGGKTTVEHEEMRWHAARYLPVNDVQIPTGTLADVKGTPFDFLHAKPIGQDLAATGGKPDGYDHTMVVEGPPGQLRPAVTVFDPASGRIMDVWTTEPGVQFYTGNFLDGTLAGRGDVHYGEHDAFALEAQDYPDAVNQPTFPSCLVQPGQAYTQTTEYRFAFGKQMPAAIEAR